jgi:hypothetical protein
VTSEDQAMCATGLGEMLETREVDLRNDEDDTLG